MSEVLSVLTYKSASHIVSDCGTQSWKISRDRARRCAYVVCVRHQQGPYKAEGDEPHKHAFLIGKVSDVVNSGDTDDRYRVAISEYALLDGPQIPLVSASPTQYFPSLSSMGIDEGVLDWKPISDPPGGAVGALPVDGQPNDSGLEDVGNREDNTAMSVFAQAKKLISERLHVPVSAIEIFVRA